MSAAAAATPAATSLLALDNVHAYYGAIHALKGVSLVVGDGEIVTLLGRERRRQVDHAQDDLGTAAPAQGHHPVRRRRPDAPQRDADRQGGRRPVAGGPAPVRAHDRDREPRDGRLPAYGQGGHRRGSRARLRSLPAPRRAPLAEGRHALGRRAADVRDGPGAARAAAPAAAGRALDGSRARARRAHLRGHRRDQRPGHDGAARGAERADGARDRASAATCWARARSPSPTRPRRCAATRPSARPTSARTSDRPAEPDPSSARSVSSASCVAQMTAASDRRAALDQQAGDERGALLVESRGRLVQQHDVGPPGERTRDRDPLALPRREAIGRALDAIAQAEALQPRARLGLVLGRAAAVLDLLGEQHVLERSGERDEARLLADPADVIAAVRCQLLAVEPAEIGAGDDERARVRALQAGDEVQQRGLAGAGTPLDGDQPAACEGRPRSPIAPGAAGAAAVALVDPAELRTRPRRRRVPRPGREPRSPRAPRRPRRAPPRPRRIRQLARPPMPASSRALSGRRTQPPRPTTSLCEPPRTSSPLIRPSRTCTTRSASSVGGLVVADDHERRPAAGDHLAEQAIDRARRAPRRARPPARRPGAAQGRGRAPRRPRRVAARRPRAPRADRLRGLPGPCRRAARGRAPAARCSETPPSARGSATLSAHESAGERARA